MWGHTGLIRATSYTSDVTRHFCIQANRVVVGSRKCPGRRESLPAVGGTGDGWGVRVWGGRGPVHEGVAEAAVVGIRLALLVRKARRKAGRTAVERMSSRLVRASFEGADLGGLPVWMVMRPRPGGRSWVPTA